MSERLVAAWGLVPAVSLLLGFASPPEDDDDDEVSVDAMEAPLRAPKMRPRMKARMAAPAAPAPAAEFDFDGDVLAPEAAVGSGATPGGVQDVNLLRALVHAGTVPRPGQVTAEGLFSEVDLPLRNDAPCGQLLCVNPEATDARLTGDPDRHYLVQLGFASNLDLDTFERAPLHLVFAVDVSASMGGPPLEMTRASIQAISSHLGPRDRVSVVVFEERAQVLVSGAGPDDPRVAAALDGLYPRARSNLDVGLGTALELATQLAPRFEGRTRVISFSDDQPTHGRTGAGALVPQVRRAAEAGVGLTAVGVGLRFDPEFAASLAEIRGGSVLFFDEPQRMRDRFESDFDTMFLELAHELEVVIEPAPGLRVTELYGLPESAVERRGRGLALRVETVFSSRSAGAIYFAVDPEGRPNLPRTPVRTGMALGQVRLTYREVATDPDGARRFHRAELRTRRFEVASPGLTRGSFLIDEFLAIERAAAAHGEGDSIGARKAMEALLRRFEGIDDAALAEQRDLVMRLGTLVGASPG